MSTNTLDTLPELHQFVADQAAEDAVLSPSERAHQEEIVRDVLLHEPFKPTVVKKLFKDYSHQVASHVAARNN